LADQKVLRNGALIIAILVLPQRKFPPKEKGSSENAFSPSPFLVDQIDRNYCSFFLLLGFVGLSPVLPALAAPFVSEPLGFVALEVLRLERLLLVLSWSFWVLLDLPVCDADELPSVALSEELAGAAEPLALSDEDAEGGVPLGVVDCDCWAKAPVARIVQSASEPIPSTFSVELIVCPFPEENSLDKSL